MHTCVYMPCASFHSWVSKKSSTIQKELQSMCWWGSAFSTCTSHHQWVNVLLVRAFLFPCVCLCVCVHIYCKCLMMLLCCVCPVRPITALGQVDVLLWQLQARTLQYGRKVMRARLRTDSNMQNGIKGEKNGKVEGQRKS